MADPPPVPQAAMRAAAAAVPFTNRDAMRRIIEYAAPHIRAAEREACAQLAEQHGATASKCPKGIAPNPSSECGCRAYRPRFPFAALLRKDRP